MPTVIDPTTLVPIGTAAAVVLAIIGCTWRISARMTKGIATTERLETSIDGLANSFNNHVLRSDTRDQDNQREHHTLSRCCDVQAEAIKGFRSRMEEVLLPRLVRVEQLCDRFEDRGGTFDRRLAVLEAQDAG